MSKNVQVTYFDTAMVLLDVDGVRLLTDPVLDGVGSAFNYGPVHLEKTSAAAIAPEKLGHIDAVLLSHDQHGDNLDRAGRALLARVPRVLTTPEAAPRLDSNAEGLASWQSVTVRAAATGGTVTVTAVPAQHGPDGTQEATGTVTGFVITSGNGTKVYVSGDTILFPGTEEVAKRYAPVDLAVLHLGRARIEALGPVNVSLTAEDAVHFAKALGARKVLPVHFEGWAHFTEGRDQAMHTLSVSEIASRTLTLRSGETATLDD
jgi:L-ascorbate metabolism protein UlaG (beta-lactamase superfamily)